MGSGCPPANRDHTMSAEYKTIPRRSRQGQQFLELTVRVYVSIVHMLCPLLSSSSPSVSPPYSPGTWTPVPFLFLSGFLYWGPDSESPTRPPTVTGHLHYNVRTRSVEPTLVS